MNLTAVRFKALCIACKVCRGIFGVGKATSFVTAMLQYHYMPKHPERRCVAFVPKIIDPAIRQAAVLHIARLCSPEINNAQTLEGD